MTRNSALRKPPSLPATSIPAMPTRGLSAAKADELKFIARDLKHGGWLKDDDLGSRATPIACIVHAVGKAISRIHGKAQSDIGKIVDLPPHTHSPFLLSIPALEEIANLYSGRCDGEALSLYVINTPFLVEPAFSDPKDRTAFRSAVAELSRASSMGMVIGPEDVLEVLSGAELEMVRDVAGDTTFSAEGKPVFGEYALSLLEGEWGLDVTDEDSLSYVMEAVNHVLRKQSNPSSTWTTRSRAVREWRKERCGTPVGNLVSGLLALASRLARLPNLRDIAEMEWEGEPCAIFIQSSEQDEPEILYQALENYGTQGIPIAINLKPLSDKPGQLCELYQRVLMEASIVTAAMNLIVEHERTENHSR